MFLLKSTYFIVHAELGLLVFLVQVATGLCSIILTEANFGWLIRSIHRWSESMMVLMMILHVFRVCLTDGFKKPCELTWVTSVVFGVLTVSFSVTGYSLPPKFGILTVSFNVTGYSLPPKFVIGQ